MTSDTGEDGPDSDDRTDDASDDGPADDTVRVWLVERTYSDDVSASEASRGS